MKPFIVFLPGLGEDQRLFFHQKKAFPHSLAPPWLLPQQNELLPHYARRWAKRLKLKPNCFLVGVSFGGMVALEMAKWVRPRAVILVGSCLSPESIPPYFRMAGSLPYWPQLAKRLCRIFPIPSSYFLGAKKLSQRHLVLRMFLESPDGFVQWTMEAIRNWEGFKGKGIRVRHIHGERDHLIPAGRVQADQVVRGGGHLINLTHPHEVNRFIRRCMGEGRGENKKGRPL